MCHESWWQERRTRRADEAQQVTDDERTWPVDAPEVPDERPAEVRLDAEEHEPVLVER
jgi:hypothetical protein